MHESKIRADVIASDEAKTEPEELAYVLQLSITIIHNNLQVSLLISPFSNPFSFYYIIQTTYSFFIQLSNLLESTSWIPLKLEAMIVELII